VNRPNSVLNLLLVSVVFIGACQQEAEMAPTAAQSAPAAAPQAAVQQARVVDLIPAAPAAASTAANGLVSGAVVETVDSGGYTYARVDVNGQPLWAAGPMTPMAVGDTISFSTLIPMQNFHSKTMNRDFPVLYFVDGFTTSGASTPTHAPAQAYGAGPAAPSVAVAPAADAASSVASVGNIEKVAGGYTIAEILAQRNELTGKPIKVRGQVTKVVSGIMGKNWVHISDSSGNDDFIVTTSGTASNGQVVVAEGNIALNRDFGYGYKYDILMEDATVTAE
jgi:hypothetical protein